MKKILAIALAVAMLLSVGVIATSAARSAAAGAYATGNKDTFKQVGDVKIQWVADAATKLNITDGKMDDWADYAADAVTITPDNMVSWVGCGDKPNNGGVGDPDAAMPEGWQMIAYFVGDKDYLYVGFYITDPEVVPVDTANKLNYGAGDAFQINIDFGKKLGEFVINNPEDAELMSSTKNIFYSFGYCGDGESIAIQVQESDVNNGDACLNEDQEHTYDVAGATGKTEEGWCAEFRLPWQRMYDDYGGKAWLENLEDSKIYIGGVDMKPLQIGAGLYYLNHSYNEDGTATGIDWAAGTHSGSTDENFSSTGAPVVGWDVYDNAMTLVLEADPKAGIEFTSPNIEVLMEDETEPPTEAKTDAPTEKETEKPTEKETDALTAGATDAPTSGSTNAPTTGDDKAEDEGCASVIGMSAVILMAAAAAVVLKKKD